MLESAGATGRSGEVICLPVPLGGPENADLRCVALVGIGAQQPDDLRRAGAALARELRGRSSVATTVASVVDEAGLTAFVVGAMLGSFRFTWRSTPVEDPPVGRVVLADLPDPRPGARAGGRPRRAGWRSRMLATVPSNLKNPPWLAAQAERLAKDAGLDVTVHDEDWLAEHGFAGSSASVRPRRHRLG